MNWEFWIIIELSVDDIAPPSDELVQESNRVEFIEILLNLEYCIADMHPPDSIEFNDLNLH